MKFFMFLLFFVVVVKAQANTYTNAPVNFNPIAISGSQLGGGTTNVPSPIIPIGSGINPPTDFNAETQSQDAVPEPATLIMILIGVVIILSWTAINKKKV